MICRALGGQSKEQVLLEKGDMPYRSPGILKIARGDYREMSEDDVRGTGYVVASLQASLWCFAKTNTFEEAVLRAVNLGDDADTTAAVCGQLSGAFYGESAIPERLRAKLVRRAEIADLAERLRRDSLSSGRRVNSPKQEIRH